MDQMQQIMFGQSGSLHYGLSAQGFTKIKWRGIMDGRRTLD